MNLLTGLRFGTRTVFVIVTIAALMVQTSLCVAQTSGQKLAQCLLLLYLVFLVNFIAAVIGYCLISKTGALGCVLATTAAWVIALYEVSRFDTEFLPFIRGNILLAVLSCGGAYLWVCRDDSVDATSNVSALLAVKRSLIHSKHDRTMRTLTSRSCESPDNTSDREAG